MWSIRLAILNMRVLSVLEPQSDRFSNINCGRGVSTEIAGTENEKPIEALNHGVFQ